MGIQTKFLRAARGGDTAEVLKFLGQGVDVNACNEVSRFLQLNLSKVLTITRPSQREKTKTHK